MASAKHVRDAPAPAAGNRAARARPAGTVLTLLARRAPGRLGLLVGRSCPRHRPVVAPAHRQSSSSSRNRARDSRDRPAETVARGCCRPPPRASRDSCGSRVHRRAEYAGAIASAQVFFANVLRGAFAGAGDAQRFPIPPPTCRRCSPEAAPRVCRATRRPDAGGAPRRSWAADRDGVTVAVDGRAERAAAVIVAVGTAPVAAGVRDRGAAGRIRAAGGDDDALDMLDYEPIVTVCVWAMRSGSRCRVRSHASRCAGPAGIRPAGCVRACRQGVAPAPLRHCWRSRHQRPRFRTWRSARGPGARRRRPAAAAATGAFALRVVAGRGGPKSARHTRARRGAYRSAARGCPGIYLARDYVDTDHPATLEAAVEERALSRPPPRCAPTGAETPPLAGSRRTGADPVGHSSALACSLAVSGCIRAEETGKGRNPNP